ncbi:N-acetylmuramoyl-L-alanine amidase [Clostridium sp. MSJ-11]|uniref:N-acetylmuramoyl-L-alanine amidase n=1 Tax=Clostridium mobile TaxID=2841512 RepID=A0ABS6EMJ9_9CLOT|nr:N-acetylmuramoyl-L-alanine amidase [Clostridium mobile]MBU5486453.1 N-acetylmuramoyl-L-alanine amidase [Clostridium mobile]
MLSIQKMFINYNFSKRNEKIKYICIHDVGAVSSAKNNRDYFAGGNRGASADFFVDSNNIIQIINYHNNYSWAIGDGGGKYGITNANSLSIEMCLESNYQPSEKTIQNTIDLVKRLMKELNITIDRIVRHYDASRKNCPQSFSANNWAKWNWFKSQLIDKYLYKKGDSGSGIKKLQQDLLEIGYKLNGGADGIFGESTYKAILNWQQLHTFLRQDGIVDENTLKSINTKVEELKNKKEVPTDKLYKVQVGACKNKEYAINLLEELKAKGFTAYIREE